jgi:hypothetical protein
MNTKFSYAHSDSITYARPAVGVRDIVKKFVCSICKQPGEGTWNQKVHKNGTCDVEYNRNKERARSLRKKKQAKARQQVSG